MQLSAVTIDKPQIGFLLDTIGSNQTAYSCIHESNDYLDKNNDVDICVFVDSHEFPCINMNFGTYHLSDLYNFEGIAIATSLKSAYKLKDFPVKRRVFYVQDLPGVIRKAEDLEINWGLLDFQREGYDIIFRSKDHATYCNTRITKYNKVVEDFNIEQLLEILNVKK